jgi:hypothetical protein
LLVQVEERPSVRRGRGGEWSVSNKSIFYSFESTFFIFD